jgi:hypothetical protein
VGLAEGRASPSVGRRRQDGGRVDVPSRREREVNGGVLCVLRRKYET